MLKLEDLQANTHVTGIEPGEPVEILNVKRTGPDTVDVRYERRNGDMLKKTLFRADEAKLALASEARVWAFDGKPDAFKLAAEAMRIRLAHLFDPMMAVHTSDVDPLPHQIAAVYEAMLPRQPLRFVLADDPGAGKTIMAGLLIRELMLRGDLQRCLIIAPGSLVEQWQAELADKFGLRFDILSSALMDETRTGNAFAERDLLIARLDQLARKDEWHPKLCADNARWDLVVIDEAHKAAAHYFGGDLVTTDRYKLALLVGSPERTRHFLLMTATPHNGKEEDFQAWLALVDPERFHGKAREPLAPAEIADVMRRMVKEELIKFDGTKLFPDRIAETVHYTLSPDEMALYDDVTAYVREQMGRAEELEGKKKGMVGFALTVLQRRLASSPQAIAESLRRRRQRLEERLEALRAPTGKDKSKNEPHVWGDLPPNPPGKPPWERVDLDDPEIDLTAEELEDVEEDLVDAATSARTMSELTTEIGTLRGLEDDARAVLKKGVDRKWDELSKLLQSNAPELFFPDGRRRKMIIFTEHRDTLEYLKRQIARVLSPDAIVEMHGAKRREERLAAQERFRQDPKIAILIATDAAGEGVNLQVASLMVNYDLPWNPNRIEQRFGRIHRIGQMEPCRLWSMVARETREGEVYDRLFLKLDEERKALGGKVFDILGQSFEDRPLRDLLIEAIRCDSKSEVRDKVFKVVDGALDHRHLQEIIDRNALTADKFSQERLYLVKEAMEKAEAKKLQPFYLRRFVTEALRRYGGDLRERERGRYEIKHVPGEVRARHAVIGGRRPVLESYQRVTFDRHLMRVLDRPAADLVHPAHPLMAALIDLVLAQDEKTLHAGTVLVDPTDPGKAPRLMFMIDHAIREGATMTRFVSRRVQFVEIDAAGNARHGGAAPYLSYETASPEAMALLPRILAEPWLGQDLSSLALGWATQHLVPEHFEQVKAERHAIINKTLMAVHERLTREINHWSKRANDLAAEVRAGKQPKMQPDNARKRADELKGRLAVRTRELEAQLQLSSNPPVIVGTALVLPYGLVHEGAAGVSTVEADPEVRRQVELAAMRAVIAAEEKLGNKTKDVSREKCGWDVTSVTPSGETRHIEVKGRHADAETVTVTSNEILEALNQGDKFLLAIVRVKGAEVSGPHYVRAPFAKEPEGSVVSVNFSLKDLLARAKPAHLA